MLYKALLPATLHGTSTSSPSISNPLSESPFTPCILWACSVFSFLAHTVLFCPRCPSPGSLETVSERPCQALSTHVRMCPPCDSPAHPCRALGNPSGICLRTAPHPSDAKPESQHISRATPNFSSESGGNLDKTSLPHYLCPFHFQFTETQ